MNKDGFFPKNMEPTKAARFWKRDLRKFIRAGENISALIQWMETHGDILMLEQARTLFAKSENLFWAQELQGEDFVAPIKKYHGFMVQYNNRTGENSAVRRIVHIATGIFAYPLLGALALVGMCIKALGISSVARYNEEQKKTLSLINHYVITEPFAAIELTAQRGWAIRTAVQYTVSPQNQNDVTQDKIQAFVAQVRADIDSFTNRYEKIRIQYSGDWLTTGLKLCLTVFESTSPFCRRDNGIPQEVAYAF